MATPDDRFSFEPEPPAKALAYLEAKGLARSWRWPSMWQAEHAFAFTLAGVYRLDVIGAARELMAAAVRDGTTLATFQKDFEARLNALGFEGPQLVTEFDEGPRKVNLSARQRMRVIYDTNLRQAYAAAEWQAVVDTQDDFPALSYHHIEQEHPRLQHLAFDGVVLPVGHPFWKVYFPPNGWFCKCYTLQVSRFELARGEKVITTEAELAARGWSADPADWPEWTHEATGRVERVPPGVDPGFGFNAGMARRANLGELLAGRIAGLDPDLARAAAADLVNLPLFQDMAADAIAVGRDAARGASPPVYRDEAWPVGVLPAASDPAGGVVVARSAAIGRLAEIHAPARPADWRRVQLMLERGQVWKAASGDLVVRAPFTDASGATLWWSMWLRPAGSGYDVASLAPLTTTAAPAPPGGELVRGGAGPIPFAD